MDESELRKITRDWIEQEFKDSSFVIRPVVFHDLHMDLDEYVAKKFSGEKLKRIHNYSNLTIQPDIIALIELPDSRNSGTGWVIAECKAKFRINKSDFREYMEEAQISNAFMAYMVYEKDHLSRNVIRAFKANSNYDGMNKWGSIVSKYAHAYEYNKGSFAKVI